MRISVTFRHMEPTEEFRKYAEEKIGRLKKYLYNPADVKVVLSVEKHRNIAEIVINADKTTINGKETTDDMYKAIDTVIEKIEKQIKRHKGKLIKHKGNNVKNLPEAAAEPMMGGNVGLDEGGISIITKTIDTKPMTVEEAAMQLDMSNSEFMVFQNADTKSINVVYKRKDSNYGHIVPTVKK
ncbi:MAG: ribosome-associated translation inhibitor RaiA [Deltaproteobacteria bacterium]|uniref:Ribosome hibernation promoting factor n=1 Tax=Candidatus Zymogenus saltonus TaxID=2844893 RepID=A0A9D8KJZ9_9DELT|nr:ribosome-associated translation inhibitor RaiA [Candidatus Zymogenus saltonus]